MTEKEKLEELLSDVNHSIGRSIAHEVDPEPIDLIARAAIVDRFAGGVVVPKNLTDMQLRMVYASMQKDEHSNGVADFKCAYNKAIKAAPLSETAKAFKEICDDDS